MSSLVKMGETYESKLIKEIGAFVNVGIHSFESLNSAKCDGKGKYVKCIIPKGSHYYEGDFNDFVSYASDKLTYVELVE